MKNQNINHSKIKRELIHRDTNFDSRFTTKIVRTKKAYKREKFDLNGLED
jgi:hypothetical protein